MLPAGTLPPPLRGGCREQTVRWGMVDQLKSPPPYFKEVIESHFRLRGEAILANVRRWAQWCREKKHPGGRVQGGAEGWLGCRLGLPPVCPLAFNSAQLACLSLVLAAGHGSAIDKLAGELEGQIRKLTAS